MQPVWEIFFSIRISIFFSPFSSISKQQDADPTKQQQHNKNFLVSIMFSHYDQNNNGHLEFEELQKISADENIRSLSDNSCSLVDMLRYDDKNGDASMSLNEFNQAFNKLYSVSMVSLDKALETNHLSVRIGDNVEIKCDVTGQPLPLIVWQRYNYDLYLLKEPDSGEIEEIRVFNDGSLYITNIQLKHAGNYTCHAQRNKDIVQTHIITVHSEYKVTPRLWVMGPDIWQKKKISHKLAENQFCAILSSFRKNKFFWTKIF